MESNYPLFQISLYFIQWQVQIDTTAGHGWGLVTLATEDGCGEQTHYVPVQQQQQQLKQTDYYKCDANNNFRAEHLLARGIQHLRGMPHRR